MCGLGGGILSRVSQRTRRRRLRIQDSALRLYGWGSSAPSKAKIDQKPVGGVGNKPAAKVVARSLWAASLLAQRSGQRMRGAPSWTVFPGVISHYARAVP